MSPAGPAVVLVAAVARNGVIGAGGQMPWHLPGDLAHFRRTTEGHVVLMGRRTFDSIGRPLPRRTNVVVTRDETWSHVGVHVAHSVEAGLDLALALAAEAGVDVMVVGGGEVYRAVLPRADVQVISEVAAEPDGDTWYPEIDRSAWTETTREPHDGFDVVRWERRT